MTVVKPGTQTRRFTHVYDTVETCFYAWKKNKNRHYSISNKKSYSIYSANTKTIKNVLTNFIKYHKTENINDDYKNLSWDDKFTNLKYLFKKNDK